MDLALAGYAWDESVLTLRLLIDAIENRPVGADKVKAALANEPGERFAVSPLIKMEGLIQPLKTAEALPNRLKQRIGERLLLGAFNQAAG